MHIHSSCVHTHAAHLDRLGHQDHLGGHTVLLDVGRAEALVHGPLAKALAQQQGRQRLQRVAVLGVREGGVPQARHVHGVAAKAADVDAMVVEDVAVKPVVVPHLRRARRAHVWALSRTPLGPVTSPCDTAARVCLEDARVLEVLLEEQDHAVAQLAVEIVHPQSTARTHRCTWQSAERLQHTNAHTAEG